MKTSRSLLLLLAVGLLLPACANKPINSSSTAASSNIASSQTLSDSSEESSEVSNEPGTSSEPAVSSEPIVSSSTIPEKRLVTFYAMNDFHGAVKQNMKNDEPGILALGTYLKEKGEHENTVLINSGDMFQGAIESNYNRGKLLTDCMNEIEFDSFALGNHEFDWGLDYIRENKLRKAASDGYQTPWLSANLYDYNNATKQDGTTQQSDLGECSTTLELENGLKVGIIGGIGQYQWTSICSQFVDDVVFKDPINIIKSVSDDLRTNQDCDLVVLSMHADEDDVLETGLTSISSVSKKKYVDAVFCAHSHQKESSTENDVVFTQNNAYGKNISQLTLTIDPNCNVTSSALRVINSLEIVQDVGSNYDQNLQNLVTSYAEESDPVAAEAIGTGSDFFNRYNALPNMLAYSILKEAQSQGYSPALAMTNVCRKHLYGGSLTYGALFESVPFDNEIYIIECTGADIIKEATYQSGSNKDNYFARVLEDGFEDDKTYQIAVIDYLALHKSVRRSYDYFPSVKVIAHLGSETAPSHYRDILADYIREEKTVDPNDYLNTLWRHDSTILSQAKA